jgi:hypothetical protein
MADDMTKTFLDLLEIIDQQERLIIKQNDTIAKLVNETAEKENTINELMKDIVY